MEIGEEGLDKMPTYVSLMESVFQDNNYKLRIDGVIFLKDYFISKGEEIVKCSRFEEVYLIELCDFLSPDEDV